MADELFSLRWCQKAMRRMEPFGHDVCEAFICVKCHAAAAAAAAASSRRPAITAKERATALTGFVIHRHDITVIHFWIFSQEAENMHYKRRRPTTANRAGTSSSSSSTCGVIGNECDGFLAPRDFCHQGYSRSRPSCWASAVWHCSRSWSLLAWLASPG